METTRAKTILLVDDDRELLECLGEILRLSSFSVIQHSTSAAALDAIRTGPDIDLVITDYCMSGMDGLEFLWRLRLLRPTVPAIMLTGYGTLESYQKAASLGSVAYLPKPFRNRELLNVVANVFRTQGVQALHTSQ